MRKSLVTLSLVLTLCSATLAVAPSVASASSKGGVVLRHVTVTAAKVRGDSAISMTIVNNASGPISLISVTSPLTRSSMIDYDTNMCQGNHAMMQLANILIVGGHTQQLGYQYQGAMLRKVTTALVKGTTVPIVITWSDFQKVHTMTVKAKVVAPPRHLNFGMSSMVM